MARLLLRGVLCGGLALLLTGCSSDGSKKPVPRESSAAFVDICGRKFNGAGQWFLEDASKQDLVVNRTSPGDDVVLQLSHDCKADVHYQLDPPNAATVVASAPVDRPPVFLILRPVAQKFVVTFQRPSGPGKVMVDFTQPTTSPPS